MPIELAKLEQIFGEAAGLPGEERAQFLNQACGENAELRDVVESLLRAHDAAGTFLQPATTINPANQLPSEDVGAVIGRYKLLQKIGEGGFGVVYMAEQEQPIRRSVALKIIKLGMDTRQVIARFEAERQALAILDHPGIAKVHDGGATETGRPYFVMELVIGVPITEYCDRNRIGIRQRIEMFIQVCQAVQHAHQKGLIHRDLKPSNVLVSTIDGRPVAKVIDFGIAKATAARLTEKTLFTEFRTLIGTPEYMSPEQAEGSLDIDTRSDVYSLGALLYEILAGAPPFDPKELRSKAYGEMQRIIRELEPPRPSTRVSTAANAASIAAVRGIEPRQLRASLHGELDWIVMKCLDKDRMRRYESAAALAGDAQRFLADEPVSAAAPGAIYRLRKFVRRNKGPVVVAATISLLLIGGIIGTTLGLIEARRQRFEARAQEAEAKRQAAISESTNSFLSDMLATADPDKLMGNKVTVLQAIEAAVKELDAGKLKDQPLTEAAVRQTIGNTLRNLGEYDAARANLDASLQLRQRNLPAGHRDIAAALNNLGLLLRAQGKLAEAEPLYRKALQIWRASLPAGHLDIAEGLHNLAYLLQMQRKLDEAEPLMREALEIKRKALPAGDGNIARSVNNYAALLEAQGKRDQAEVQYRDALEIWRKALPAGHPDIAVGLNNLASVLEDQRKLNEAEPLYREALEIWRAALPAGHPTLGRSINNLAVLLHVQGKLAEAEPLFREALKIRRNALPAGHLDIARGLRNLAGVLHDAGKLAEAELLYREALDMRRKALPADHPDIASVLHRLASLLQAQGKLEEAELMFKEAIRIKRKTLLAGHADTVASIVNYSDLLLDQRRFDDVEALLLEAGRSAELKLAVDHPARVALLKRLVRLYESKAAAEPGKGHDAKANEAKRALAAAKPATTQSGGAPAR